MRLVDSYFILTKRNKAYPTASTVKRMNYIKYINSAGWSKRRKEYLDTHPNNCVICGISKNLHLHHKTYKNLGDELDEDLMLVCENHHIEIHKIANNLAYHKRKKFLNGGLRSYQNYKYGTANIKITRDKRTRKRIVTKSKRTPNHFNWYELNKERESRPTTKSNTTFVDIGDVSVE